MVWTLRVRKGKSRIGNRFGHRRAWGDDGVKSHVLLIGEKERERREKRRERMEKIDWGCRPLPFFSPSFSTHRCVCVDSEEFYSTTIQVLASSPLFFFLAPSSSSGSFHCVRERDSEQIEIHGNKTFFPPSISFFSVTGYTRRRFPPQTTWMIDKTSLFIPALSPDRLQCDLRRWRALWRKRKRWRRRCGRCWCSWWWLWVLRTAWTTDTSR